LGRHCEEQGDEAIQESICGKAGLLRFARNDAESKRPGSLPALRISFGRHAPRRRGIQYSRGDRLNNSRCGVLDRRPSRAMTLSVEQ
jgi:hypothetical protein